MATTIMINNSKPPPASKTNYHGIEVVDGVVWQGWEPGREYTKNIVLKNIKVQTQKIKYNVPSSRFFTTLYPKPIVLSAGTSFTLPITFRPLEKNAYEDIIEFHTKEGDFKIPIKALLPQVNIAIPEKLNFSMCAATDSIQLKFEVKNSGDLPTSFHWEVSGSFVIEPTEATLQPKSSCILKATFTPKGACVYNAQAVCKYGPERSHSKTMILEGIGKYPHLLVSTPGKPASSLTKDNLEAVVPFGQTPVGTTTERWIELHNLSQVRAPFRVDQPTSIGRIDTVFGCPLKHGTVPPMTAIRIPLSYTPNTVDTISIDYFHVVAIGNVSRSVIKCVGSSRGPTVSLGSKIVNFMQIDIGETATQTIEIINTSDIEAVFQFAIDCDESVFYFEETCGVLKPDSRRTIILKFHPLYPINYYRRVTCLIHNQGPIFLDLLGTCHAEMVKPAVLQVKHLARYRSHVERGLSTIPPEQLNEMMKEGRLEQDESGALMYPKPPVSVQLPDMSELDDSANRPQIITPMEEHFNDGYHTDIVHTVPHLSLDTNEADFGNCQNLRLVEDQVISLTNHTKGKLTIQWIANEGRVFSILPATLDIPPLKTCSFNVSFKPTVPNQFFGAELECFAYYKSLRDYRLVEDETHFPPWCLTLTCTGNTFQLHNERFIPRYNIDSSHLVFPAVNAKDSTYRTLLITNTGTTPILFDVEKDKTGIFSVKPSKGLLAGQHQIFVVKVTPAEVKIYKQALKMRLNDDEKHSQAIQLWGSAESPEVLLDNEGIMYFKPTCVGTASSRSYSFKNVSRIPLKFEWKLKHKDAQLLSVFPETGIIQPNESQCQIWSYSPQSSEKSVMKPTLVVSGQGHESTSGGQKKHFSVRAIGEGAIGDIKAEDSYLDYGDVIVGSSSSQHIVLHNNSNCSLHYKLCVDQNIDGPYPDEITRDDRIALELETDEGVIPARSRCSILVTVRPIRRVTYQFAISYQLLTPQGQVAFLSTDEQQHICHILATGVFPVMSVTDARCYGSAIGISKKQLWNLFSMDYLNVCLDSDPSAQELMYSVATRHSHKRRPPVYTRAILDFNFSAAPLDSEPCLVSLMFENSGTVPTEWAFLFPADLQLELEYWAETGEFDADELHEMKVMDNKLFAVEPMKGKLEPGQCETVTFTYHHDIAGTDRLPVLLKLARGREILLNFVGVTVEPERHYVHFPANKHLFTPVPVGEKISPKQIYELYNGGAVAIRYTFDLSPLEILTQENFNQPIFECLNPNGEILPGRTAYIEWRFSPLEAKTYMVDVPVHVHNGDTAIITFTGVGYDKRVMGDTMPVTDQQQLCGVPSVQSATVPGQLAYLSQERISMGNLPLFSQARRMLFVTNRSRDHEVSFEWHVTTQTDSQILSISPIRACLNPGQSMMCRVSFTASGVPAFYDLDLVCEITDETEKKKYLRKLHEWDDELERQKYEFTITEDDLNADKRMPVVEIGERPSSAQLVSGQNTNADGELTRYKMLPPIKKLTPEEERSADKRRRRRDEELLRRPVPPTPFLLHLGITARTHDIHDFQNNFPDEYRNFFIDRSLSDSSSGSTKKNQSQEEQTIVCTRPEADIISGVLSNVLRGLLDDTYFHDAVKKISQEPIPFFKQLGTKPEGHPGTPPPSLIQSIRDVAQQPPGSSKSSYRGSKRGSAVSEISESSRVISPASDASASHGHVTVVEEDRQKAAVVEEDRQKAAVVELLMENKQAVKKLPEFGNALESVIENTLLNVMSEALASEFNITARPRFVALPKKPSSATTSRSGKI